MILSKKVLALLALLSTFHLGQGQKRFKEKIFADVNLQTDIQYGEAINLKGANEALKLDVYLPPATDTMKKRPLVIFIHGGGFKNNTKTGTFSTALCNGFAQRGYVSASIDYRLGVDKSGTARDYPEALYRAQQDGKAAIRFFRRYADKYGIDTSRIYITGSSAGSKTCLAVAYMDQDEIPKEIDQRRWGTLEGNSGNPGHSSKVAGVMNCWGAIIDYKWINKGDAPLFNTAGTADQTVPYDSSYDYHGFKYGPYILYKRCLQQGIPTAWRPFYGAGHTLDNNAKKQDSCVNDMADWLFTQLSTKKGKEHSGVDRYEKDIAEFESLSASEKYPPGAVMFVGSSFIRLWKDIRTDVGQTDVIHRGFGGSNLADVAYFIPRILGDWKPKAFFLYVGNDITGTDHDKSPLQVLEMFKYVVEKVREKRPDMPIAWMEIQPSVKRWQVWDKISEANQLVKAYCTSQKGLRYVTAAEGILGKEGKPDPANYRDDNLHFNPKGYQLWGRLIKDQVKDIADGK